MNLVSGFRFCSQNYYVSDFPGFIHGVPGLVSGFSFVVKIITYQISRVYAGGDGSCFLASDFFSTYQISLCFCLGCGVLFLVSGLVVKIITFQISPGLCMGYRVLFSEFRFVVQIITYHTEGLVAGPLSPLTGRGLYGL